MKSAMDYFNNKPLSFKLLVILLIPLLGMTYFVALEVENKLTLTNNMEQIAPVTTLAVKASHLVHQLQKERGLSAGYLGSNGNTFKRELQQHRRVTDSAVEAFHADLKQLPDSVATLVNNVDKQIREMDTIRSKVDALSISVADEVAFYSHLNRLLLEIPAIIPHISEDSVVSLNASAYLNLLQAKERAGIERAVLANTFGNDAFLPGNFKKLISLITAQQSYLAVFKSFASEAQLDALNTMMRQTPVVEVAKMREIAISNAANGGFNIDAQHWFTTMSQKIDLLKALEDTLATNLQKQTEGHLSHAQQQLYTVIAVAGIILTLVLLLATTVSRMITRQVSNLHQAISKMEKDSDLSVQASISSRCEVGKTAEALNNMTGKFKSILGNISTVATELSCATQQVSAFTEQSSEGVARQRQETELVATAINEMSATAQQVAENTRQAADAAEKAHDEAHSSQQVVHEVIDAINKQAHEVEENVTIIQTLKQDSDSIGTVLEVISGIAEQTNLLALNAAIEAARAGEQGRGFAVVADEVRNLASRTAASTQEIQTMIENLQRGTEHAVNAMQETQKRSQFSVDKVQEAGDSIEHILQAIDHISGMSTQVAGAVAEQTAVAEEININIQSISQVNEETHMGSQETKIASEQMTGLAKNLNDMVRQFKLA